MSADTLTYKEAPDETVDTNTRQAEPGFMQKVLDACPGAVAVIAADTLNMLYGNRYFSTLFGTPDNIGDLLADDVSGIEASEKLHRQLLSTEANNGRRYQLYRIKTVEGRVGYFYLYISKFEGNDTDSLYYQVMLLPELSGNDLPFLSLDSREVFLENFNRMGFGTFEWHMETGKLLWSAGVYRIHEMEPGVGEVDKDFTGALIHPEDSTGLTEKFTELAEGKVSELQTEVRIKTVKQNQRVLRMHARSVRDANGKVIKLVGTVRDITDERNAQLALQKNMEDLYHSNKELEEFAYVASHDLQEPLRKITTFCDRLSERYKDKLDGEGSMYMGRITASAENMRTLINNLLEFSRIAKYEQAFAPVNLAFILKEVIHELELPINESGAKVSGVELPTVDASFTQMKQLFTNIINNAIKFRGAGRVPEIKAEARVASEAEVVRHHLDGRRKYYRISISDNGMGFENEYAQRIFQIFQRLHGKSEYPGSGIGLAICKKIVERHHGFIYAEGQPDAGAAFIFYLPEKQ